MQSLFKWCLMPKGGEGGWHQTGETLVTGYENLVNEKLRKIYIVLF